MCFGKNSSVVLALGKITRHSYPLWTSAVSLSLTIMCFGKKKQFYGDGSRKDYAAFLPAVSSHSVLELAHQEFRWKKFYVVGSRKDYAAFLPAVSSRVGRSIKEILAAGGTEAGPCRTTPTPSPHLHRKYDRYSDKGAERRGIIL